jgi:predicted RNase H-like nuclease
MVILIGIDCATQPEKVGLARAVWDSRQLVELQIYPGGKNTDVAGVVTRWLDEHRPCLLALDAPLGWPATFGQALARHAAGQPLPMDAIPFFRRLTDRQLEKVHRPMDVTADRLGRTAFWAVNLLGEVARRTGRPVPLAWNPQQLAPLSAIEVYPAGTLTQLGLPARAYKKASQRAPRQAIVAGIQPFFAENTDWEPCLEDADQLDAALCLIAGMDFICGRCPAPDDLALAKKEGWIWVRERKNQL